MCYNTWRSSNNTADNLKKKAFGLIVLLKVKSMQRPGTEAIRTHIKPSKPKRVITKITNSQNTKRTYGLPSEQLFPKM